MGALVYEHPRALGLDGPVAAAVRVGRLAVGDGREVVDARELPDYAGRDHLAELLVERGVPEDVPREDEPLGAPLRLGDVHALLPCAADGLLEKDVVALLESLDARGVVEPVGERDDDGVRPRAGVDGVLPPFPRREVGVGRELRDGVGEAGDLEVLRVGLRVGRVGPAANPVPEDDRLHGSVHQTKTSHPLQSPSRLSEMPLPVPLANVILAGSQSKPVSYW